MIHDFSAVTNFGIVVNGSIAADGSLVANYNIAPNNTKLVNSWVVTNIVGLNYSSFVDHVNFPGTVVPALSL